MPLNSLRVLLVDDDSDQFALTQAMLDDDPSCEFQIDWAATYEDGLSRLADDRYHVALIDYRLGAHTGAELLRTETFGRARVPAVVLTGNTDAAVDQDAMDAGAVDYLVKQEITPAVLRRAVRYAAERHRVTVLLEQREASLRALLQDSVDVILLVGRDGRILFASDSVRLVDGFASSTLIGGSLFERVHPDDVLTLRGRFDACARQDGQRCAGIDYRQRHQDGTWRDCEAVIVNRLSESGIGAVVVTYRDVTEQRAAETQRARLAAIVQSSNDAIYSQTRDGEVLTWNGGAERLLGYSAAEAVGRDMSFLLSPESLAVQTDVQQRIDAGETYQGELGWAASDGTPVQVSVTISPIRANDGVVTGASIVARDITEQRRIQTALADSEARHRAAFDDAPVGMAQTALDGRWLRVNRRLEAMLGYSREDMLAADFAAVTHPEDIDDNRQGSADLLAGELTEYRSEKRYRRKDGTFIWVNLTASLHRAANHEPRHFIAVIEDISERKQAQLELDHIFNLSPDMIATASAAGYFTKLNPAWRQVLHHDDETLMSRPFLEFVHPDDRPATRTAMKALLAGESVFGFTNRCRAADATYRWLEWHVKLDRATAMTYAVARDQTARRMLEEQFRQAQKMEAVGRLAGGVAHDFNNLLTAIVGFSEIALDQLPEATPLRADIDQILSAGRSAALLTKQLLAFSRKQILQPQVLDVAALVSGMQSLLRRIIGEDVTLEVVAVGDGHRICADRGQIEQVVMNLAVNARDAMPSGGTLRIVVDTVDEAEAPTAEHPDPRPGPHVRLTMTDTGVGMTPDVVTRLFEPFFTTKEPGKGTGLGLATVYGIVKQSGGHIAVRSALGQGASFEVRLPCAHADSEAEVGRGVVPKAVGGTETIMVVEDQDDVRAVVRQTLSRTGYRVIEAADGPSALTTLAASPERVHLLITDVVMPRMSGRELADRAVAIDSSLRVLYMSGYTDDAIVQHGVLEAGIEFLPKPFTLVQLLGRVRELLDRPMPPRRPS